MGKTNPPLTENNGPKELVRLCRAGRLYEIERWINDGKSLEIPAGTKRGRQRSLLEIAIETGFHTLVELIAKHEASQSAKNAALGEAVSLRRLDLVELLLANGADVNAKNKQGNTPLVGAVWMDHRDVVELLLANKADVNARDNDGKTPLGLWEEGQRVTRRSGRMAEILRQHGGHE